nr:MAG TPA: hypothetical protein [Bacteriophage sp.]
MCLYFNFKQLGLFLKLNIDKIIRLVYYNYIN